MSSRVARIPKGYKHLFQGPKNKIPHWLKIIKWREDQQRKRWHDTDAPFPVGQKKVYLPKFSLTFVNTPQLGPQWAQFLVPTWFNKLDMRDYLWHAYGEKVHTVRSYITPQPITAVARIDRGKRLHHFGHFRPSIVKKMTVELVRPFVWPQAPRDYSPWEQEKYDQVMGHQFAEGEMAKARAEIRMRQKEEAGKLAKEREQMMRRQGPQTPWRYSHLYSRGDASTYASEREWLARRASEYLTGKVQWGRPMPTAAVVSEAASTSNTQSPPSGSLARRETQPLPSIFNTPRADTVPPPQGPPS